MASGHTHSIEESFAFCERMARSHYENFPVASFLVPREKRRYIWSVYAFARVADDFADEGDTVPERRLEQLAKWAEYLDATYTGAPPHPIFIALRETIRQFSIPRSLFNDLLTAFRMDVERKRFATYEDLLHYCHHSANPIGRLVLHVFDDAQPTLCSYSDAICTALQLTNFWQDVSVDLQKGRVYLPLEDLHRFGYTERELHEGTVDQRFRRLLAFEVGRTRDLFREGKPLLTQATKRLRFELRLTWRGGMTILDKIEQSNFDVLHRRPVLSRLDVLTILITSFVRRA
jgi:phytoene synthase